MSLESNRSQSPETAVQADDKKMSKNNYDKLVDEVTDKVWHLWREQLRVDRQRCGKRLRS